MFRRNESQQLTIDGGLFNLTEREMKVLKKSWAYDFGNIIFPNINENLFYAYIVIQNQDQTVL